MTTSDTCSTAHCTASRPHPYLLYLQNSRTAAHQQGTTGGRGRRRRGDTAPLAVPLEARTSSIPAGKQSRGGAVTLRGPGPACEGCLAVIDDQAWAPGVLSPSPLPPATFTPCVQSTLPLEDRRTRARHAHPSRHPVINIAPCSNGPCTQPPSAGWLAGCIWQFLVARRWPSNERCIPPVMGCMLEPVRDVTPPIGAQEGIPTQNSGSPIHKACFR